MKYDGLTGLLDYLIFNKEEGNIELIDPDIVNWIIDGVNTEASSFLMFRFQQYLYLKKYPELVEIFKLSKYVKNGEETVEYKMLVKKIISDMFKDDKEVVKELVNNKSIHLKLNLILKDYMDKLKNRSNKDLFVEIRKKCGDVIFEKVRYSLNPDFQQHIFDIYDLLLDKNGNPIDVEAFEKIISLDNWDQMLLCRNILFIAKNRKLFDTVKCEILNNIKNEQFKDLFKRYQTLLYMNEGMKKVDDAVNSICDMPEVTSEIAKKICEVLAYGYNNMTWDEGNNLYIIRNGEQKFINLPNKGILASGNKTIGNNSYTPVQTADKNGGQESPTPIQTDSTTNPKKNVVGQQKILGDTSPANNQVGEEGKVETTEQAKENESIAEPAFVIHNDGNSFRHKQFEEIRDLVKLKIPVMMVGPAGCGKGYIFEEICEDLGIEFGMATKIQDKTDILGFKDAGGIFQATSFYDCYKNGKEFFLDEIDASRASALVAMNSAIGNGKSCYATFGNDEKVYAHEDFGIVAAANTWGTGANRDYCGREKLDAATIDRYAQVEMDYDERVERKILSKDLELLDFLHSLRYAIYAQQTHHVISTRGISMAAKMLASGKFSKEQIVKIVAIKGLDLSEIEYLMSGISSHATPNNEYVKILKNILDKRK